MSCRHNMAMVVSILVITVAGGMGETAQDRERDKQECTDQLVGLTTCLPYVGGEAKAPTPDCCSGLKQVMNNDKKCLCVVVRDRNDPQLGLNINATLALSLPSLCHSPANVSKCPELLHMDPKSPEAQVFYPPSGRGHDASSPATSPGPGPGPSPSPSSSTVGGGGDSGGGGRSIGFQGASTGGGCCPKGLFVSDIAFLLVLLPFIHSYLFM